MLRSRDGLLLLVRRSCIIDVCAFFFRSRRKKKEWGFAQQAVTFLGGYIVITSALASADERSPLMWSYRNLRWSGFSTAQVAIDIFGSPMMLSNIKGSPSLFRKGSEKRFCTIHDVITHRRIFRKEGGVTGVSIIDLKHPARQDQVYPD